MTATMKTAAMKVPLRMRPRRVGDIREYAHQMLGNSSSEGFSRAATPIVMPVIEAHSHHRGRSIIRKNDHVQTMTIKRPSGSEIASPVEKMRLGQTEIRKQAASAVR